MINVLHLIWIIPLATMFGYMIAALMVVANRENNRNDSHEK